MTPKTQSTMKAVALDQFGGLERLKVQELPIPDVGPDEVLIKVESAGVGQWDPFEREGGFAREYGLKATFPYVPGSDGAGTVQAAGSRVRHLKKGDRAYAFNVMHPKGGFYAEYSVVKAKDASPIPGLLTVEQAGGLAVDAITALRGLDDVLKLKRGESLMIFGASGGIGHLAVQLAKRMGARVLAVASGDDGVELVRQLGADAAVDGHSEDVEEAVRAFAPKGVDAALVTAGGEAADKALEAVRKGGRVAYPNGVEPEPKKRPGIQFKSYDGESDAKIIKKLNRLIEAGPFKVHVARSFQLDQAAAAQRALKEHYVGKIILYPA
jgi:NADPH:quinone reductase